MFITCNNVFPSLVNWSSIYHNVIFHYKVNPTLIMNLKHIVIAF